MAIATINQDKNPIVRGASWKFIFYYNNGVRGDINLTGAAVEMEIVNFQWAQNTATAGDTRVLIGSYLETMSF